MCTLLCQLSTTFVVVWKSRRSGQVELRCSAHGAPTRDTDYCLHNLQRWRRAKVERETCVLAHSFAQRHQSTVYATMSAKQLMRSRVICSPFLQLMGIIGALEPADIVLRKCAQFSARDFSPG